MTRLQAEIPRQLTRRIVPTNFSLVARRARAQLFLFLRAAGNSSIRSISPSLLTDHSALITVMKYRYFSYESQENPIKDLLKKIITTFLLINGKRIIYSFVEFYLWKNSLTLSLSVVSFVFFKSGKIQQAQHFVSHLNFVRGFFSLHSRQCRLFVSVSLALSLFVPPLCPLFACGQSIKDLDDNSQLNVSLNGYEESGLPFFVFTLENARCGSRKA